MDLKGLSKDNAVAILESLFADGTLDMEKVCNYLMQNPSNDMKRVTDLIHRTMCQEIHDPEVGNCSYDVEEILDTCWSEPCHQHWINKTILLMHELGVLNEDELLKVFNKASNFVGQLTNLSFDHPIVYKMVLKILHLRGEKDGV